MEKKPKSYEFLNKNYKVKYKWSVNQVKRPFRSIFECCKVGSQKSFILSKDESLSICEDFESNNFLSDIKFEKMQLISVDYSISHEPTVVCSFSSGHLLIMDPMRRKRGPIKWINTKTKPYSQKLPLFCKWISENSFIVLFGDNFLWEFNKNLAGEDEVYIKSAVQLSKNSQVPIFSAPNCKLKSNPTNHWKLSIGQISEIEPGPLTKQNLLAAITGKSIKILDFQTNFQVSTLFSYFANFLCLTWSPDGELLFAGGEDDCVHAWDTTRWQLQFKGLGHISWVSSISCQFDGFSYQLASVGHDGNLLFWEHRLTNPDPLLNPSQISIPITTNYPPKLNQNIIEPLISVQVSEIPLEKVALHNESLFIFDCEGSLNMWINING